MCVRTSSQEGLPGARAGKVGTGHFKRQKGRWDFCQGQGRKGSRTFKEGSQKKSEFELLSAGNLHAVLRSLDLTVKRVPEQFPARQCPDHTGTV